MRTLTYLVATTLDGFVAGPDGDDPTGPDGFWPVTEPYVRHLAETWPETLPAVAREALGLEAPPRHFDTVLEGRGSYEVGLAAGVEDAYPHLRHVVYSRTLSARPGSRVEVVADDPVAHVRALKQEPGAGLWLVGGGAIAGTLAEEIDRLVLKVAPVTTGSGIALLGDAPFAPRSWELVDHAVLDGGTVVLDHRRVRD